MKESQNRIHYLCMFQFSGANLSGGLLKWDLEYGVSCGLTTGDQDWNWRHMIVGQTATDTPLPQRIRKSSAINSVQIHCVLHTPLYSLKQYENNKSFIPFSPSADAALLDDFRERSLRRGGRVPGILLKDACNKAANIGGLNPEPFG